VCTGSPANTSTSSTSTAELFPVGPLEYRAMDEDVSGSPFQLCLNCRCCAAADPNDCSVMSCCFGIDCNLPDKPYGVCAFMPQACNCTSCTWSQNYRYRKKKIACIGPSLIKLISKEMIGVEKERNWGGGGVYRISLFEEWNDLLWLCAGNRVRLSCMFGTWKNGVMGSMFVCFLFILCVSETNTCVHMTKERVKMLINFMGNLFDLIRKDQ